MRGIYTIGYGNKPIDRFDAVLKACPNGVLIDTRLKPYCDHDANYRQETLERRYGDRKQYVWRGNVLGNEARHQHGEVIWVPPVSWDVVDTLLYRLYAWCQEKDRIPIFFCCEFDWQRCHRKHVADRAIETIWFTASATHILLPGEGNNYARYFGSD